MDADRDVPAFHISRAERHRRLHTMSHWSLPIVSLIIWWGMLTIMLLFWGTGKVDYLSSDPQPTRVLVYVSTVGSEGLKPLFVCGSFLMGAIALIFTTVERTVRHRGRLLDSKRRLELVSSWITIVTSIVGYSSLFCVAVFDCRDHYDFHVFALALFLGFLGMASFTIVAEFYFLDPEYGAFRRLQIAYFLRLLWSVLEVGLIASFTTYALSKDRARGCVLEWIVAYLFGIHLILFAYGLFPTSIAPISSAEEEAGHAIEHAMLSVFCWTGWVRQYRVQCQAQRELTKRGMLYQIDADGERRCSDDDDLEEKNHTAYFEKEETEEYAYRYVDRRVVSGGTDSLNSSVKSWHHFFPMAATTIAIDYGEK